MTRVKQVSNSITSVRQVAGFALPTILIASIVMLMVLLASVSSTTAVRTALKTQYYQQLAGVASEAGLAYANACLKVDYGVDTGKPLWGNAKPLRPGSDCSGNISPTCTTNPADVSCSVTLNGNVRSSFMVGTSTLDASGKAIKINSSGSVDLLRSSNGSAWRSYGRATFLSVGTANPTFSATSIGNTGTVQSWTAPATGTYKIQSMGASGGRNGAVTGGQGHSANMTGEFFLYVGDVLYIVVGQQGLTNYANINGIASGGGGGGASLVSKNGGSLLASTPLIVGGGGGGAGSTCGVGNDASITTSGGAGFSGTTGGTAGSGGTTLTTGAGGAGAGWLINGGDGGAYGGIATALNAGAVGGPGYDSSGGQGGFGGGGGGGNNGGGGGGGYSGGGGCDGGGGSYNVGLNQSNSVVTGIGQGYVTVKLLTLGGHAPPTMNQTIAFTGAPQTFTVPAGVTWMTLECFGGKGGINQNGNIGGSGGYAKGELAVAPGDILNLYVGGDGANYPATAGGWNGGGSNVSGISTGGGGTDIRVGGTALSNRIIVAGGSSGGGIYNSGAGGGGTTGNGSPALVGTQTTGNALGVGGSGYAPGGGGYWGGMSNSAGGSGGGGSGYTGGVVNPSMTNGTNSAAGKIIISW